MDALKLFTISFIHCCNLLKLSQDITYGIIFTLRLLDNKYFFINNIIYSKNSKRYSIAFKEYRN